VRHLTIYHIYQINLTTRWFTTLIKYGAIVAWNECTRRVTTELWLHWYVANYHLFQIYRYILTCFCTCIFIGQSRYKVRCNISLWNWQFSVYYRWLSTIINYVQIWMYTHYVRCVMYDNYNYVIHEFPWNFSDIIPCYTKPHLRLISPWQPLLITMVTYFCKYI